MSFEDGCSGTGQPDRRINTLPFDRETTAGNIDLDLGVEPAALPADRHRAARTGPAGHGLADAAFMDSQADMRARHDFQKLDVGPARKLRMILYCGAEPVHRCGRDRVDEDDGMWIADRYRADLKRSAGDLEGVGLGRRWHAERQRLGRKVRHAHGDRYEPVREQARVHESGRALERELARAEAVALPEEGGETARTISALLDLVPVGVEDLVVGGGVGSSGRAEHESLVEADAGLPVGQRPQLLGRGNCPHIGGVEDDEVIAEAVHLHEVEPHGTMIACRDRVYHDRPTPRMTPMEPRHTRPSATRTRRLWRVLAAGVLAASAAAAAARDSPAPYLYAHHAVSTSISAAQAAFDRGLTLTYAYQGEEAERAFREAAKLDPTLAMAWWGIALALGPDINTAPEVAATRKAAKAIARARLLAARRATQPERDYIEALAARYNEEKAPDFDALALAYRDRMRELTQRYPHDADAAAEFAEALMDVHPWRLWTAEAAPVEGTLELVAVIEAGLREHPEHIGLMHYYIHAVEASDDPGRALAAARLLASLKFEPAASHLVHMPAHTFLRVGDWVAAVNANEHAMHHALDYRLSLDPATERACAHCLRFLSYAYAMQGNFAGANGAARVLETMDGEPSTRIAVLARFRRFEELLTVAEPLAEKKEGAADPHVARALWHYGRALARLGTGEAAAAAAELELERKEAALAPADPVFPTDRPDLEHLHDNIDAALEAAELKIADALIAGRLALARADDATALASLRAAVDIQDRAQYSEPPAWYYPVRETLAATLEKAGALEEAAAVLKECLRRAPHDARATLSLRRVLTASGHAREAAALDGELVAAQSRADAPLEDERL